MEFVHLGSRLTSLSISNSQNTYEPISDVLLYEGLEFLLEKKNYPCLGEDLIVWE